MVNWTYEGKEIKSIEDAPEDTIGFIYKITNLSNGKYYYGRKTFRNLKKKKKLTKKEKLLPENKRKTYKYVEHEYKGWKEYTGSSEALNKDLSRGDKYKKEVVKWCKTKKGLTAWETQIILCNCILEEDCYNGHVLGKIFKKDFE